jgi:hypothetical protein
MSSPECFCQQIITAGFGKLLQLHDITAGAYSLRLIGPTLDDHASIMIEFCFRIRQSSFLPKDLPVDNAHPWFYCLRNSSVVPKFQTESASTAL